MQRHTHTHTLDGMTCKWMDFNTMCELISMKYIMETVPKRKSEKKNNKKQEFRQFVCGCDVQWTPNWYNLVAIFRRFIVIRNRFVYHFERSHNYISHVDELCRYGEWVPEWAWAAVLIFRILNSDVEYYRWCWHLIQSISIIFIVKHHSRMRNVFCLVLYIFFFFFMQNTVLMALERFFKWNWAEQFHSLNHIFFLSSFFFSSLAFVASSLWA